MKSFLSRTVAAGAVAATVVPAVLALAPSAYAVTGSPSQNDAQVVGGITLYDSQGHVITSGKLSDRPVAAFAVGDKAPRSGDASAALFIAQPDPAQPSGNWNADQLSAFTAYPNSKAPAPINGFDATRPVVTGAGTDESVGNFVAQFPSPPAGSSDSTWANLYQLRIKTANAAGTQTDTYDALDIKVDTAAGTWTEVNAADTTAPSVIKITTPTTLTGDAFIKYSETVTSLVASDVKLIVTGGSAVPTGVACFAGSKATSCSGTFDTVRLRPLKSLVAGQHYTVVASPGAVKDTAGNPSTGASKAFRALRSLIENNAAITRTWQKVSTSKALGGSYVRDHLAGAVATWTFKGTAVTLWTVTGKDQGKADITIDGVRRTTINNYATSTHYKVARTISKLHNSTHTIRIVVDGKKGNAKGTDTFVSVDGFTVGKTKTSTPALLTTWRTITDKHLAGTHAVVADLGGESFSLTFRGTSVTWVTETAVNQGQVAVYLDGTKKSTVDDYATKASYGVKRTLSKLSDKVHTLKVVVLGKHHAGGKGNLLTLDAITVG